MQEACCPPCSEYSICCPNWVPPSHPDLAGGYPAGGYPTWVPPMLAWGVPCQGDTLLGYSPPVLAWPGGTLPGYLPPPTGYPHPDLAGGVPCQGVPYLGTPPVLTWLGGTLPGGTLPGYPPSWPGRVPPTGPGWVSPSVCTMAFWVMLQSIMGYGYPPSVCPMAFWVMLQSIMGYGYPPGVCPMAFWVMLQSIMGYGYPHLWTDRRTDTCQNITFPSYYVRGR